MKMVYKGKRVVKNEFGYVINRFPPIACITYDEKQAEMAAEILERSGYEYNLFGFDDTVEAYVTVEGKDDYDSFASDFRAEWKKRSIQK